MRGTVAGAREYRALARVSGRGQQYDRVQPSASHASSRLAETPGITDRTASTPNRLWPLPTMFDRIAASSLRVGFDTLRANPLRTLLSTLGIIMGVAALVSVL